MRQLVALDLGGTFCRLGRFALGVGSEPELVAVDSIETISLSSFRRLMEWVENNNTLAGMDDIECLAVAVPGAVEDRTFSQPVNIPWDVSLLEAGPLAEKTPTVLLLNDFVAQGLAIETVAGRRTITILDGGGSSGGAVAVIGVGTGLGKAAVIYSARGRPMIMPSEGGQASFSPETEEEFEFARLMCSRLGRRYLNWDRVLSGGGLSDLHTFLTGVKVVPSAIMAQPSENSVTVEWFARLLGRACRNYVLETLTIGGLFFTGGVLQRNPLIVRHSAFRQAFHDAPGRHGTLLSSTPVRLIMDPNAGLRGAALAGAIGLEDGA